MPQGPTSLIGRVPNETTVSLSCVCLFVGVCSRVEGFRSPGVVSYPMCVLETDFFFCKEKVLFTA